MNLAVSRPYPVLSATLAAGFGRENSVAEITGITDFGYQTAIRFGCDNGDLKCLGADALNSLNAGHGQNFR